MGFYIVHPSVVAVLLVNSYSQTYPKSYLTTSTHIHINHFNEHFPDKSGLAGCLIPRR